MSSSSEVVLWSDGAGSDGAGSVEEYAFRCAVRITMLIGLATIIVRFYTIARRCATIIVRFYTIARLCLLKHCGCCCRRRFVGLVKPRGSPGFIARVAGQAARNSMR